MSKKLIAFALAGIFALSMVGPKVAPVKAVTIEELEALIADLTAKIAALTTQTTGMVCFDTDLSKGMTTNDVKNLQIVLNKNTSTQVALSGAGSPGNETTYFGSLTFAAVKNFQASKAIINTGYVGPLTRAALNLLYCIPPPTTTTTTVPPTTTTILTGGAGSIEDADFVTSLNNEEVGEGVEDVKVAGLEIEADDGSDIMLKAVRLEFVKTSAGAGSSDDFEDYADEVSILLGSKEVARLDADEFNDDNDYEKTVSFASDAVIKAGETANLYVAVSGIGNLDSDDDGETWTVEFASIRFADAQGATINDDDTGDIGGVVREFSFETFATAADLELRVSLGDDEINDAHVIDVDDSDETEGAKVLSFMVEAEGDSDLLIDDLVVEFVLGGTATQLDDIVSGFSLLMDGEEVGTENVVAGADLTVTFDDLNLTIDAGDEVEFIVAVDILEYDAAGTYDEGDTIQAEVTDDETDLWDVEDEAGEDLEDGDKTGTAVADALGVYDNGISAKFISSTYEKTTSATVGINETVEFTLKFDVTAFGDDAWVEQTCVVEDTGADVDSVEVSLDGDADFNNTTCTDLDSTGDEGVDGFEVIEGQTERFTVTILGNGGEAAGAGNPVTFTARINGIGYNVGADAVGDTVYAFDLANFKSSAVTVYDR